MEKTPLGDYDKEFGVEEFIFFYQSYLHVRLINSLRRRWAREVGESAKHVILLSSARTAAGKYRVNMRVRKLLQLQNP